MRTSLIGTVFLFACIFGQNSSGKKENVQLLANSMPCSTNMECQIKLGRMSQCKDSSCMCPIEGQWRDCPLDESVNVMVNQARQLKPGSFIGHPCIANVDCKVHHAYCRITTPGERGICECEKGFIHSKDFIFCHEIANRLNDFCFEDRQCRIKLKNSTCSQAGKCECQDHYHEAAQKCWKSVEYGEPCGHNHECWHIRGTCNEQNKTCVCDVNQIIDKNRKNCLHLVGNNERCFEDIQCALDNLQHSLCILGRCTCKSRYHYSHVDKNCVKVESNGEHCEDEESDETEDSSQIALCPTSLIWLILFLFLL